MHKQALLKVSENHRDRLAEIALKRGIALGRHVTMKEVVSELIDKEYKKAVKNA